MRVDEGVIFVGTAREWLGGIWERVEVDVFECEGDFVFDIDCERERLLDREKEPVIDDKGVGDVLVLVVAPDCDGETNDVGRLVEVTVEEAEIEPEEEKEDDA